jgi:hypothetical protein
MKNRSRSSRSQTIDLNTRSASCETRTWTQCDKDKRIMQTVETGNLKDSVLIEKKRNTEI